VCSPLLTLLLLYLLLFRRHSMDGLEETPSSNNISNTDTSQDEIDAHSPSGRYAGGSKQRLGRANLAVGAAAGAGMGAGGVEGSALHRSPQATHAIGEEIHSWCCAFDSSIWGGGAYDACCC
jgi:hypothetical protein